MKFAEYLASNITPEWRKKYIPYEEMKEMLYGGVEECKSQIIDDPENSFIHSTMFYEKFDQQWFQFCDEQLDKINQFYAEKLAEAKRKYNLLREDLDIIQGRAERQAQRSPYGFTKNKPLSRSQSGISLFLNNMKEAKISKMADLKLAYSEFYLSLILLQNYQKLNSTGFRKIQKKHDKLMATDRGAEWKEMNVDSAPFNTSKENDRIIQDTEAIVINELEGGDRPKAMKRLRVPPAGMKHNPWRTFKVGLFSGVFLVLLACVILTVLFHPEIDKRSYRVILRLYRGPFLLILFVIFMSINIYGWRCSGVNHILIFELDPRSHISEIHLLEMAAGFSILWVLSILGFLYSTELSIAPYLSPLVLVLFLAGFLLNPIKTFYRDSRFWLLNVLSRIICAPFFYVGFADFWLADQLNSLVQVLQDTQYTICFYASSGGDLNIHDGDKQRCTKEIWMLKTIVAVLPAWFRFMQCFRRYRDTEEAFPHLANAGKYSTTFFVILFSTLYYRTNDAETGFHNIFFYLWIISALTSSIYSYIWDIKMDWGLLDPNPGPNRYLRKEIVYAKSLYYFGIVEDLLIRFGWAISMSLSESEIIHIHSDIIISILTPLELIRRFIWNFYRLENEHLNNCGKFRAVRDIAISSLYDSDKKAPVEIISLSRRKSIFAI